MSVVRILFRCESYQFNSQGKVSHSNCHHHEKTILEKWWNFLKVNALNPINDAHILEEESDEEDGDDEDSDEDDDQDFYADDLELEREHPMIILQQLQQNKELSPDMKEVISQVAKLAYVLTDLGPKVRNIEHVVNNLQNQCVEHDKVVAQRLKDFNNQLNNTQTLVHNMIVVLDDLEVYEYLSNEQIDEFFNNTLNQVRRTVVELKPDVHNLEYVVNNMNNFLNNLLPQQYAEGAGNGHERYFDDDESELSDLSNSNCLEDDDGDESDVSEQSQ